jgi:hypothetical protein
VASGRVCCGRTVVGAVGVEGVSSRSTINSDKLSLEGTRGVDLAFLAKVGLDVVDGDAVEGREGVSVPAASTFAVGFRSRPEQRACAGGGGGMIVEGVRSADGDGLGIEPVWLGSGGRFCGALGGVDDLGGSPGGWGGCVSGDGTKLLGGVKLLSFKVAGSFHVSLFRERPVESGLVAAVGGANWPPAGLA